MIFLDNKILSENAIECLSEVYSISPYLPSSHFSLSVKVVIAQSFWDYLLYFLSYHEGILPRLARGWVILRGHDRYIFCYSKVAPSPLLDIVVWDYSPPRQGGQFEKPASCIAKFPPIAEMIYLKSFAICILNSLNTQRMKQGKQAIAGGPLLFENESLAKAQKEYRSADQETALFCFLEKFNSFNHYSMVAYPVGLHKDHFKHGKESLEN